VRAHRSFRRIWKERDSAQPELLEKILDKDNLNRAYKRVKANKEAPGIDGMSVEEIGAYLRENQKELIERIKGGKYTPDPVRRVGTGCLRLSGFYGKDFWNRDTCTLTRRRYRCWVKPEGRTPQMLIKAMKKYPGLPDFHRLKTCAAGRTRIKNKRTYRGESPIWYVLLFFIFS